MRVTQAQADRETQVVYRHADALWARFSCPASSECCQLAKTQRQPWLWPSEWRLLTQGAPVPQPRADGACPYLDAQNRCSAYERRPLGCRTFFCHRIRGPQAQPVREMDRLLSRLERVNLELDEDARPRPLLEWYEAAR